MNSAKKLGTGWYEYKGYEIYHTEHGFWTLTPPDSILACDSFDTKKECMEMVDYYENR